MNETDLAAKGYRLQADGSWAKRPVPVGAVENPKRQPHQRGQGKDQRVETGPSSLRYCVAIISLRRRLVDAHDNLRTGAKPLVDRITWHLGFSDDADPRITWEYAQVLTRGPEGTIVTISVI